MILLASKMPMHTKHQNTYASERVQAIMSVVSKHGQADTLVACCLADVVGVPAVQKPNQYNCKQASQVTRFCAFGLFSKKTGRQQKCFTALGKLVLE